MFNTILSLFPEKFVNFLGASYYKLIYKDKEKGDDLGQIFSNIYSKGEWGNFNDPAFSGLGSRGIILTRSIAYALDVIKRENVDSILDIGCGDGHFTEALLNGSPELDRYKGVDIVDSVIQRVSERVTDPRASFDVASATDTQFKGYGLVIIRQVLQHLSNEDIQKVLDNVKDIPLLLILEHFPTNVKTPNHNIVSGKMTRRFFNSCVDIEAAPFVHNRANSGLHFDDIYVSSGGILKTNLYHST